MTNSHTIQKISALALAGLLSFAGSASAAVINIGNINLAPNLEGQVRAIRVTGGGNIQTASFAAVVENGGPQMANHGLDEGAPGPKVTLVDLFSAGAIFHGNNDFLEKPRTDVFTDQFYIQEAKTLTGTVNADDGILAYVTFDTRGFNSEATFDFDLRYFSQDATQLSTLDGQEITVTPGTLTILVPEPASLSMLALGGLMLLRRRR